MNNATGAAYVYKDECHKYRLPEESTIFTAEAYSIQQSLTRISHSTYNKFLVLSDSLSVLSSIKSIPSTHPTISNIRETLETIFKQNKEVYLIWIPSHIGIPGNEKADQAAKSATEEDNIIMTHQYYKDVKLSTKKVVFEQWQTDWNNTINNKLRLIKQTTKPWTSPVNRQQQVLITRLRIGHTRITHAYLFRREDPPICNTCHTRITVDHLLRNCTVFEQTRGTVEITSNNLTEILNNDSDNITKVLKYLKITGLYNKL